MKKFRAKCAALTRVCISGATQEDQEKVATWVVTAADDEDRELRMLCVELLATHLRTGSMEIGRVMVMLQGLYLFASIPATPATPEPVVASPGAPSKRYRPGRR